MKRILLHVSWVVAGSLCLLSGCGADNKPTSNFTADFQRFQKEPNPETAARNLASLALLQKKGADAGGAERTIEAAVKRAGEIKDADGRAIAFNAIASAQGQLGLVGDCRKSLKEVQSTVEKMSSDEARSKALARMALSYETYLSDATQAKHYFAEAEKTAKNSTEVPAQARGLIEVARYLNFAKDAELKASAAKLIAEAKAAASTIEDDRAKTDALLEIVITLDKGGNKAEASASLQEVLAGVRSIANPAVQAHVLVDVADRLKEIQRQAEGKKLLEEAYAASQKVPDPSLKKELEQRIELARKG